jgi:hypothetical protein
MLMKAQGFTRKRPSYGMIGTSFGRNLFQDNKYWYMTPGSICFLGNLNPAGMGRALLKRFMQMGQCLYEVNLRGHSW